MRTRAQATNDVDQGLGPVFSTALSMEDGEQFVDEGDTGQGLPDLLCVFEDEAEVFELEVDHEGWFHVAGEDARAEDLEGVAAGGSGDGGVKGGLEVEAGTFGEGESFGDAHDGMDDHDLVGQLGGLTGAEWAAR